MNNLVEELKLYSNRMSAQIVPVDRGSGNQSSSTSSNTSSSSQPPTHVSSRFLKKRPPDLYGQRHAIETSKCISDSLRLLEKELQKIPQDERSGIEQASVICPEIYASKEHRLLFLRCEQFNADVSSIWGVICNMYLF